jgi:hypothetical protein
VAAAPVAAATASAATAYGQHGIAAELAALIKDLSNSQVVSATSTAAGAPANLGSSALSALNAAFSKLIADLGGPAPSAPPSATSAAAASTSSSPATSAGTQSSTASLQAFLSSFLKNLESSAHNSWSPRGNGVNLSA